MTRQELISQFEKFVPKEFAPFCADMLAQYKVQLKVKRPRNTKSGDYRPPVRHKQHQVTVNSDLNPYYFLLVYVHEMAHVKTWEEFGRKVDPHGNEWRENFRLMAKPMLDSGLLPQNLQNVLKHFFIKTPATFLADPKLTKVLKQFDQKADSLTVDDIPMGSKFFLTNGLHLVKESKLRTWYLCKEVSTGRGYRVKGNAEIEKEKDGF